jgi:hypothetical protein
MESIQNVVAGVYTLLQGGVGRLNQNELDWSDVLELGTDVMRGFVRDGELAHREHRTITAEAVLELDSAGVDYLVSVATLPDFEPTALQYNFETGSVSGWGDVKVVDLDAFPQYYNATAVYGAFYGGSATPEGLKLRLNVTPADVCARCWRITLRLPLFAQLQLGSRPPLPVDFMRMVKLAWAIACVPIVKVSKEKREEWRAWKKETLPQYAAELLGWNNPADPVNPGRWQQYLNGGVGSTTQAIPRYDEYRRDQDLGSMGGVLGAGGAWGYRGN